MALQPSRWWSGALVMILTTTAPVLAAGPCPDQVTLTATTSVADLGWSGIGHGVDGGALQLPLAIHDCSGSSAGACGTCNVSGPVADGRCALDAAMHCTTAADCGPMAPCRVFASPPAPIDAGGIPLCLLNEVTGTVSGTVEPDAGGLVVTVPLRTGLYDGDSVDQPCPICVASRCVGGARAGLACTVDVTSEGFGATSLDCPPADPFVTPILNGPLTLATANRSVTLTSDSPDCRTVGSTGPPVPKCFCDTCNDLAGTSCTSNADCVAVGATRCGGKRCLTGANAGAPCSAASACPGGVCAVPGSTAPNSCNQTGCQPSPFGDGECADGPIDQFCAAPESHRGCRPANEVEDCPRTHSCSLAMLRPCYLDNGVLGASVSAPGMASPPIGGVADVALGGLACGRLTGGNSVLTNPALGLPGLLRWRVTGTLAFRTRHCSATPSTCRSPVASGGAALQLRDVANDARDQLVWRWRKGAATSEAELGDPRSNDAYALCIYDGDALVSETAIGVAETCAGRPCWHHGPGSFRFGDRSAAHGGLHRVVLRAGVDGAARIEVVGSGVGLDGPSVATLAGPLTVQWQRAGGPCWGAVFSAPFDRFDGAKGALRDASD